MKKCRKCGEEHYGTESICLSCLKKFTERREKNFNEAIKIFGKVSKENLKQIQEYTQKDDNYE
jgi:hypothetical protein